MSGNPRVPMIVVKRKWFDEFAAGRKTIEYRRYGRMFNEAVFYPGRAVRIANGYDPNRAPVLHAVVKRFERTLACDCAHMPTGAYPDLKPEDELALIHLEVLAAE